MATLFDNLSTVTTGILDITKDVASTVVATPVLLIGVGIGLIGIAVGIFKRFA